MSIAVDRKATRVWVLNVGDLKPYEREIEFFINYGWNASRWSPDNLDTFISTWAQREFDVTAHVANTITDIVGNLTRFNSRRKPELLNSTTFSLINYREYDRHTFKGHFINMAYFQIRTCYRWMGRVGTGIY